MRCRLSSASCATGWRISCSLGRLRLGNFECQAASGKRSDTLTGTRGDLHMRPYLLAVLAGAVLAMPARAADLRYFDDAALRAVQFIDTDVGWAVGDEGVVWKT